ncbi:MAG TPA: Zn-ribbon domain-containing OB-fold protein [Trebonia sp.]
MTASAHSTAPAEPSAAAKPQRISTKPVPEPTRASRPFWEGCKRGELLLPVCGACGRTFFYPRILCPYCGSDDIGWRSATGRGTVYTHTTVRMSFWGDAFADDIPYNVSFIELDEGVRIVSAVVGIPAEEVRIGMPVAVEFEPRGDYAIPVFRPVGDAS